MTQPTPSEADEIRARVASLVAAARGSCFFGGNWDPGIVSVASLCEAVGIPVPEAPDTTLTDAERADLIAFFEEFWTAR